MPTRKTRYSVTVDQELLKKVDDYRFENRFQSRAAATETLIHLGLAVVKQTDKPEESEESNDSNLLDAVSPPAFN